MILFNVETNIRALSKKLDAFALRQLPFATAQALTGVAKAIVKAEQVNEVKVLDRPKGFTTGAIGVIRATKDNPTARVYMKDLTARYLEPYEFGGLNVLNGRALLKPVGAVTDLDKFGNLPRGWLAKMKGRSDIYVGKVQTKTGTVDGVWQRVTEAGGSVKVLRGKGGQLRVGKTRKGLNTSGKLKLLVKFENAHKVRERLDWFGVAGQVTAREFNREFGRAMAQAIATAKN